MAKLKIGILISGRGSDAGRLVESAKQADYPAEIALVVSNVADAPGLATQGRRADGRDFPSAGRPRDLRSRGVGRPGAPRVNW